VNAAPDPYSRAVTAGLAVALAIPAYVAAKTVEFLFLHVISPNANDVIEISDLLLASAAGVMAYLWLDLKRAREVLPWFERDKVIVDTQLATAAEIQRRLLPSPPPSSEAVTTAVRFEPAWQIGGDFYDFIRVGRHVLLVVIGDISGKGIPAAMLLAFARTVLRMGAVRTTDPAELLELLSNALYEDNQGSPYATCLIIRVDQPRGTLTYANAGHPPGLIVGASGDRLLDGGGLPAGLFPQTDYISRTLPFAKGDVAVLVTDGVTEADRQARPVAALLGELVRRMPPHRTPAMVCDAILSQARGGEGPSGIDEWEDDRTVVVFEVNE
jgi:serine phosphatase RsbU (regulator of sigma subunit)